MTRALDIRQGAGNQTRWQKHDQPNKLWALSQRPCGTCGNRVQPNSRTRETLFTPPRQFQVCQRFPTVTAEERATFPGPLHTTWDIQTVCRCQASQPCEYFQASSRHNPPLATVLLGREGAPAKIKSPEQASVKAVCGD